MKSINKNSLKNNISPLINSQMPASKTRKPKDDKKFKQHVNQREAELLSVKPAVRIQKLKICLLF
jgi:hypothetical protein